MITTFLHRYYKFLLTGVCLGLCATYLVVYADFDNTPNNVAELPAEEVLEVVPTLESGGGEPDSDVSPEEPLAAPTDETADREEESVAVAAAPIPEEDITVPAPESGEPLSVETDTVTTPENVEVTADDTLPPEELMYQEDFRPQTPRDCHTPEARDYFGNPGECMRLLLR